LSTSVLVTGGAGFIGSALTHRLVKSGYDVAVMDVLHPQVHAGRRAVDLPPSVRLFTGDVTHAPDWDAVLRLFHPSQIVHLAGTAQSLSQATRHGSINVVGTAQLLDALSRSARVPDQFVLASSRAVYGEGAWQCGTRTFYPRPRSHAQLLAGIWDPRVPRVGQRLAGIILGHAESRVLPPLLVATKAAAKLAVGDWIKRVYNRRRRHSAIATMSPVDFGDRLTQTAQAA
jgi:dTDP-L-rhamnose 4-epimerase